jgi:hypothetical protein
MMGTVFRSCIAPPAGRHAGELEEDQNGDHDKARGAKD